MNSAEEWDDLFLEFGQDFEGNPLPLSVRTNRGEGQIAGQFAPPYSLPGLPQLPNAKVVRTSSGTEKTAQTAVYAPRSERDRFTPGSRVTLADGRESTVVGVETPDVASLFAFVIVRVE